MWRVRLLAVLHTLHAIFGSTIGCIYTTHASDMCSDIIVELNVGKGDTLASLAEMYQIPFEKILAANEGMKAYASCKHH